MAKKTEWDNMSTLTADIALPQNNISAVNIAETPYTVVDVTARQVALDNRWRIEDLKDVVAGGVNFRGKTAVAITDGSTTKSIAMAGSETPLVVEAGKAGDMVIVPGTITGKEDREFIWDGTKWNEFGNGSNLKAFAFVNTGKLSATPAGSVVVSAAPAQAAPITGAFTGTAATLSSNITINSYTPEGNVTIGAYTPSGDITINNIVVNDQTLSVKEVSSATFTGNEVSVAASFTGTQATLTASTSPSEGSKTFSGTLKKLPALSAAGTVSAVTGVNTTSAASGSATVVNGVLNFNFANVLTAANVTASNINVSVTPSYTNTLTDVTDIAVSAAGNVLTSVTVGNITYTPSGTITTQAFTPEGTIDIGQKNVSKTVSIGTLSATGSFSGKSATLTAEFDGTAKAPTASDITISYTPAGSISGTAAVSATNITGTFTGTPAEYIVYPKE